MEEAEKEYIRSRLYDLCKNTRCGEELLNLFYSKRVLSSEEKEIIESKTTSVGKSSEFYKIIQSKTSSFSLLLQGLQQANQSGALQILAEPRETGEPAMEEVQTFVEAWLGEQPSTSKACLLTNTRSITDIKFDVLHPVLSFTGRTNEIDRLHQMVLRGKGAHRIAVVSQVTPVSGLGGIGKTQLAREYVRVNGKEFDGNVLWMNAESEESLTASFQRLAKEKLNLPTKDGNGREIPAKCIAEAVYKYFDGRRALFVLDNAEKASWLKQFMPKVGQGRTLFLLITSRETEWDRAMEVLQLDGLIEEDAVKLIQQELSMNSNDAVQMDDARKLSQTLQCFPLALQQAIAYIYEQRITQEYSIEDYLQEFECKQHQLLNFKEEQLCNESFSATTATTWSITIDKIKNDLNSGSLASLILNVVAYLGADNIKRNLFYRIPSVCTDIQFTSVNEEQINEAVRLLVKYSMLNARERQSRLSVHRLVQSVTQNQLAQDGLDEYFLEVALHILQGSDENDFLSENLAHALVAWRHAFTYNRVIQGNAWQVNPILWKMREFGHHDEGFRFGNEALEIFKKVLGEDHKDCLLIQRNIGLILKDQGYVDKAVSVFQDILIKAKPLYGEDNKISLLTKEDLGNSLKRNGKCQKALKILKEVLEKKKAIFGDNHSRTLKTEEHYGLALMESGNLTEAEKIFQRILKIYSERGNENSICRTVFILQDNLSTIYFRKGDNKKALEIQREVYKKVSSVWVENVDLFAEVCYHLGRSLNAIGQYEEALKILEEHVEKIKKRLGNQHFRTLEIQQETGISYRGLEKLDKALEIFQSVHQGLVSISGEDSLNSMDANKDVAITLSRLGHHSQALSKFHEMLPKMAALFGKENYDLLIAKRDFALAIERSAVKLKDAVDLLKNVKAALIPITGEDSRCVEEISNDIKRIEKKIET